MTESPPTFRRTGLACLTAIVVTVALMTRGLSGVNGVVALFGRWDVLTCSLMAAMPLVLLIVNDYPDIRRRLRFAIACGSLAVTVMIVCVAVSLDGSLGFGLAAALMCCRWAIATASLMAVVMLACALFGCTLRLPMFAKKSWSMLLLLVLFAVFVPVAYTDAVADGVRIDLENSLDSGRFALAQRQAWTLSELTPRGMIRDQPLTTLVSELDQTVSRLEAEVRRSLSPRPPISEVGRRITSLMHLDRMEDALRLLNPLARNPQFRPICLDYQGLCWQRLEQYSKSLDAYQSAVAYWQSQPGSDQKRVSMASAWKGVGFAARRLSDRSLEEHAYRTLVELSPTAESHFLLAQSYSDHQKTKLAAKHSAIAVQLDPQWRSQSESMLISMSRDHFGCLQIP